MLAGRLGSFAVSWVAWYSRAWEIAWGCFDQHHSVTAVVSEELIHNGIAAVHNTRGRSTACTLPSSLLKGGCTHQHGVDRFDV